MGFYQKRFTLNVAPPLLLVLTILAIAIIEKAQAWFPLPMIVLLVAAVALARLARGLAGAHTSAAAQRQIRK
jgi:hypothetical protein